MRLSYALTALLVTAACAAPAAQAMPDLGPGSAAAAPATVHDPSGGMKQLPDPPTWPTNPRPIAPVPAEPAQAHTGDGPPWDAIAFALAGAALVLAAAGTFAGRRRRRRSQRPRVA